MVILTSHLKETFWLLFLRVFFFLRSWILLTSFPVLENCKFQQVLIPAQWGFGPSRSFLSHNITCCFKALNYSLNNRYRNRDVLCLLGLVNFRTATDGLMKTSYAFFDSNPCMILEQFSYSVTMGLNTYCGSLPALSIQVPFMSLLTYYWWAVSCVADNQLINNPLRKQTSQNIFLESFVHPDMS